MIDGHGDGAQRRDGKSETGNNGNLERKAPGKIKDLKGSTGILRKCWNPALSMQPLSLD